MAKQGEAASHTINPEGGRPTLDNLHTEFSRCLSEGDWQARAEDAEDTRLCLWAGQSSDGKKWSKKLPRGTKAFPWEGASDVRTFLVDEVCSENAESKYAAFWRATLRLQGVGPEDASHSGQATTFLDWLVHGPMAKALDAEVELSAQTEEGNGWFALHVRWRREVARRLTTVKMEQLVALSQQPAADPELMRVAANLPGWIRDPLTEREAVNALQYLYHAWVKQNLPEAITEDDVLDLSTRRARTAVRELRETQKTQLPIPVLIRNEPEIVCLKPYRDVLIPPETGEVDDAPVLFVRSFYTEEQLRSQALSAGWDAEWVEQAILARGKYTTWQGSDYYGDTYQAVVKDGKSWRIEVVYAYYKTVDADGVSACEYTVFSPHVTECPKTGRELVAIEGLVEDPDPTFPVYIGRRERLDRSVASTRSVAELLSTTQQVEKVQYDSVVDLTSIAVVPPLQVPKGLMAQDFRLGPAARNEYQPGRETKAFDIPKSGAPLAFDMIQAIERKVDRWQGRFSDHVNPAVSQLRLETRIRRFLMTWSAALNRAYQMTLHYAPELVERVTGIPAAQAGESRFDYVLHFDAAQLNPDLMTQKLDAYSKLLPEDAAGVIDRAKFIAFKANLIDPAMARALISDQAGASQKVFRETQADLAAMAVGMPPAMRDASDDPTSGARMQNLQQLLMQSPDMLRRLDGASLQAVFGEGAGVNPQKPGDPDFSKRLTQYAENLQMGVKQQQNKTIGRLGVGQN